MDAICIKCGEPVATELFYSVEGPIVVELITFCPTCGAMAESETNIPDNQGGFEYATATG